MAKQPSKKAAPQTPKRQKEAPKKGAFLAAFAVLGNVTEAALSADIARGSHYRWMESDPNYVRDFAEAQAMVLDRLIGAALRMAIEGEARLKFHEGRPIMIDDPSGRKVEQYGFMVPAQVPYVEYTKSATMQIFMLKSLDPKRFRENLAIEHSGEINSPLTGEHTQLPTREELLKRYLELAKKMPTAGRK